MKRRIIKGTKKDHACAGIRCMVAGCEIPEAKQLDYWLAPPPKRGGNHEGSNQG